MKIDKEKFNKLKQLDRIEFRQKRREIDETYNSTPSFGFMFVLIIIGFLFILLGLNLFEISLVDIDGGINEGIDEGREIFETFFNAGILLFKLAFLIIIIEVLICFVSLILKHKKMKELHEEYFDFKVEVKK